VALTQLNSVTAVLKAVGVGLLDGQTRLCLRDSFEQSEGDAKVDEMVAAVARFVSGSPGAGIVSSPGQDLLVK
jgi:DNA-binding FrmR family transcriptional regulator